MGGGEGATLREVLRRHGRAALHDGRHRRGSRRAFEADSCLSGRTARLRIRERSVIVGDALAFLREDGETYDAIVSDLTEPLEDSPSNPLFCGAVFADIKRRLRAGRSVRACRPARRDFTTSACTRRWRARCALTTVTCARFTPTCRPSITIGLSCCAAIRSMARRSLRNESSAYVAGLRGSNYFYDSETHRRLFSLPLYVRRALAKDGDVFA